jgi:phosphoribosyl 1,2-cyclic phosphodiesterase
MKIRCWGTRGSIPSPGPSTLRYGGNTSCVEVRLDDGTLLILDAGSGIRPLGATLGAVNATLLLSHYHWDHIQGMPFFTPCYLPDARIDVWGPEFNGEGPDELLTGQMLAPYFPAPASEWRGIRGFHLMRENEPISIGGAHIRAGRLCHPGLTYGYRIEHQGRVFAYCSDNEPDVATPEDLAAIVELVHDADVLLHDCQYTEAEYILRRRWGHSTPRQAAYIASAGRVHRLMLFHHEPAHSDEALEALADEARALSDGFEVLIAREGQVIEVGKGVLGVRNPTTATGHVPRSQ